MPLSFLQTVVLTQLCVTKFATYPNLKSCTKTSSTNRVATAQETWLLPLPDREYLPPANEVWGKVMFLHLCVILFIGGVCIQGGSASRWESASRRLGRRPTPPPPHYGIRSISGRYASYWNAFFCYMGRDRTHRENIFDCDS